MAKDREVEHPQTDESKEKLVYKGEQVLSNSQCKEGIKTNRIDKYWLPDFDA